jgi:hypothetical protein
VERIGAFFIGPPAERTAWERTIIEATNEMHDARRYFERKNAEDDTLRGGISYSAGIGVSDSISIRMQLNITSV